MKCIKCGVEGDFWCDHEGSLSMRKPDKDKDAIFEWLCFKCNKPTLAEKWEAKKGKKWYLDDKGIIEKEAKKKTINVPAFSDKDLIALARGDKETTDRIRGTITKVVDEIVKETQDEVK